MSSTPPGSFLKPVRLRRALTDAALLALIVAAGAPARAAEPVQVPLAKPGGELRGAAIGAARDLNSKLRSDGLRYNFEMPMASAGSAAAALVVRDEWSPRNAEFSGAGTQSGGFDRTRCIDARGRPWMTVLDRCLVLSMLAYRRNRIEVGISTAF